MKMPQIDFGGLGHSAVLRTLPSLMLRSLNSRYAVRYRLPKPLRASHTRKTLSAIAEVRIK